MQMKIIADKVFTNKVAQFSHDMQKNSFIANSLTHSPDEADIHYLE